MPRIFFLLAFSLLLCNLIAIIPISNNPIYSAQSTQGATTTYLFTFILTQNITSNGTLKIGFPAEFNYTVIASNLACKMRNDTTAWSYYSCLFIQNFAVLQINTIYSGNTYVAIQNVQNPLLYNMSSQFSVASVRSNIIIESDQNFGKVIFSSSPIVNGISATVIKLISSNIVSQGSSYQFDFNLTKTYPINTTVRINFPSGFSTNLPMCKITGLYNQIIPTFVLPNNRSVQCRFINKTLYKQAITVIGMYNPDYAGLFQGFSIQIIQIDSTIILQTINIASSIQILPGQIITKIVPQNNFVLSTNIYTFYMNLFHELNSTDYIRIKFPLTWKLYQNECIARVGFIFASNQHINCYNYTDGFYNYLNITNFTLVPNTVQQQLLINLTTPNPSTIYTPPSQSIYTIQISTWNYKGMIDLSITNINLNSTYGTINMSSIDAIKLGVKLPAGGSGPLQLTFFLNYNLFQTNVLTNGTLIITIMPQIPAPPISTNGIIKCFFFMTYQDSLCNYDTSDPTKTVITLMTPQTKDFQYSEIPITITTEGGIDEQHIGLTIDSDVTRYLFQCYFYTYQNKTTPTEVYFSEYIADPIPIPSLTAKSVDWQSGELTHIQINVTIPQDLKNTTDNYVFKVSLLGTAWDPALGYAKNQLYQNYPCTVSGGIDFIATPVRCDLYTFDSGTFTYLTSNGQEDGPYFIIYGFSSTVLKNDILKIQIPNLLIKTPPDTNYSNYQAQLKFSIMIETPAMLQPYVQLFNIKYHLFTLRPPSTILPTISSIPNPPTNSNVNSQTDYIFNWTWTNSNSADTIIYRLNAFSMPSLSTSNGNCNSVINSCMFGGLPANWVVIYYAPVKSSPVSSTVPINFITNPPYSGNFLCQAIAYASGLIIGKINFNINYTPNLMTLSTFTLDSLQISAYYGIQHYYSISFVPITTLQNNCFIRLIFKNINLGNLPYCASTTLLPLDTQGILCTKQSSTTLKIYNIQGLVAAATYTISVRLVALLGSINQQVSIYTNYLNTAATNISIVDQQQSINVTPVLTYLYNNMNNLNIQNPRTLQMTQKINYIGPLSIVFTAPITINPIINLTILLYPHQWNAGFWTTPNNNISDPVVCRINTTRVPCIWNFMTFTSQLNPISLKILSFTLTIPAGIIISSLQYVVRLQTQYLDPYNGIKYPSQAGYYLTELYFSDGITQSGGVSYYTRIDPDVLQSFHVSSVVSNPNQQTLFIVEFTVKPTNQVFANLNTSGTFSQIFLQFPTIDKAGNHLFQSNLGGYTKTGDYVGCAFNTNSSNYVLASSASNPMKCRLILSQNIGQPVRVEIINFAAFTAPMNSMQIFIGNIFNPVNVTNSVQISIQIQNVISATNLITEIYRDYFDVFLYPQNPPSPTVIPSSDPSTNTFFTGIDVGDGNSTIKMVAQTISATLSPFYFVVKLPSYLSVQNTQIVPFTAGTCPSQFIWCITMPQINYIIVYSTANNSIFYPTLVNYPYSISQSDSLFNCLVWQNKNYLGTVTYTISSVRWKQIQGLINNVAGSIVGLTDKNAAGRLDCQILVSFTTTNTIFVNGSIQIRFPPSIIHIRPHCRSAVALGSTLLSSSGNFGQIGCMVQIDPSGILSWVITGFATLIGPANIKIYGEIDMPTTPGVLGNGQIITYLDQHNSNIYQNGSRIDYISTNFGLTVSNNIAFNANPEITMYQTLPLRIGYVGSFRLIYYCDSLFMYKTGMFQIRLNQNSIFGQSGGFGYNPSSKKVCEFMNTATNEKFGCIVTEIYDSTTNYQSIIYQLSSSTNLLSGNTYLITITTQTGLGLATEGLAFPTKAGIYKIDVNIDLNGAGTTFNYHNHLYLQVYGTAFNLLKLTSFVTIPTAINLIWVEMIPNTPIDNTNHIVIQFPTVASDNTTHLFDQNLGMYIDYQQVPLDIFDSPNYDGVGQFWQCNFYMGNVLLLRPAKIVCGNLQLTTPITNATGTNNTLKFAFKIINPTINQSQISLPIIVYTYDPTNHVKTNFNLIDNAVFLKTGSSAAVYANFATVKNQLQTYNQTLSFTTYNPTTLMKDDYYILLFSFPIRVNGYLAGGCKLTNNATVGDLYYHWHNKAAVCHVTASIANPGINITTPNLMFLNFYTPWYMLSPTQQYVTGYASYLASLSSSIQVFYLSNGNVLTAFPLLGARKVFPITGAPDSLFQMTPVLSHLVQNQLNDYKFTIKLQNSASAILNDLQYCKAIAINFPTTSNMTIWNTDCIQTNLSTIEVEYCWLDMTQNILFIQLVQKEIYLNTATIQVVTRNLALQNPNTSYSLNSNLFTIQFYSWENQTGISVSSASAYTYLQLDSTNIAFSSLLSFTNLVSSPPVSVQPFYYAYFPYQRYYSQFVIFNKNTQYAPFMFDMYFTSAMLPFGITTQTLTIHYGSDFTTLTPTQRIQDFYYYKPVCYLNNNRILNCIIDNIAKNVVMTFNFIPPANTPVNVYASMLDPRDSQINGFQYVGITGVSSLRVQYNYPTSPTYSILTSPFNVYQTQNVLLKQPYRCISLVTPIYGHTVENQLNVITLQITFNDMNVNGLVFQFPLIDELLTPIYSPMVDPFFGLTDGSPYPCGNGFNSGLTSTPTVKCYIKNGDATKLGIPTRIHMTDFMPSLTMSCRLVFYNPISPQWLSIKVKAYGGGRNGSSIYGENYLGYFNLMYIFQATPIIITPYTGFYSNIYLSTPYFYPVNSTTLVWRDNNQFILSNVVPNYLISMPIGQMSILQIPLEVYNTSLTQSEVCQTTFPPTFSTAGVDDILYLTIKNNNNRTSRAFVIHTWTGSSWIMQCFKCKHFDVNNVKFIAHYFSAPTTIYTITHTIVAQTFNNNALTATLVYFDMAGIFGGSDPIQFQIDLTSVLTTAITFGFKFIPGTNHILKITFTTAYWALPSSCQIFGGLSNSWGAKPDCQWLNVNTLLLSNFDNIPKDPLINFYRVRVGFSSTYNTVGLYLLQATIVLFTNYDAYNLALDYVFSALTTQLSRGINCYWYGPVYSAIAYSNFSSYPSTFTVSQISSTATTTTLVLEWQPMAYLYLYPSYAVVYEFFIYNYNPNFNGTIISSTCNYFNGTSLTYSNLNITATGNTIMIYQVNIQSVWNFNSGQKVTWTLTLGSTPDQSVAHRDWIGVGFHVEHWLVGSFYYNYDVYNDATTEKLANIATINTSVQNELSINQFQFKLKNIKTNIGPNTNKILLVELIQSTGPVDPFKSYINNTALNLDIQCTCIVYTSASPILTGGYVYPRCIRRKPQTPFLNYAITIQVVASIGNNIVCFFPEFKNMAAGTTLTAEIKTINMNGFPDAIATNPGYYGGYHIITSIPSITFISPAPLLDLTYNTDILQITYIPGFVGLNYTTPYNLTVTYNPILTNTDSYIYINFGRAGPVPVNLCANPLQFISCRVYTNYQYIFTAKLSPSNASNNISIVSILNMTYPPTQFYNLTSYDGIVYVDDGTGTYIHSGLLTRTTDVMPMSCLLTIQPDLFGTNKVGYSTNIIVTFNMGNLQAQLLYPSSTGSMIQISWDTAITTNLGCQVYIDGDISTFFDCQVYPTLNYLQIKMSDDSTSTSYSTASNLYVIFGILNPNISPVKFTLTLYSYYYSSTNYGISVYQQSTYIVDLAEIGKSILNQNYINMYDFSPRINVDNINVISSPIRFYFRLSQNSINMAYVNGAAFIVTAISFNFLPTTNYECYFKQFSSFKNLMQHTQHVKYYSNCLCSTAGTLIVSVPRLKYIDAVNHYELVIYPLNVVGFSSAYDIIQITVDDILLNYSSQTIQQLYPYTGYSQIQLISLYTITTQPLSTTSIQLKFYIDQPLSYCFPQHWIQIIFLDLNTASWAPYTIGNQIPCSIRGNFTSASGCNALITNPPRCILNKYNNNEDLYKIKIEGLGNLVAGQYIVAIDDFTLPDVSVASGYFQPTKKFDIVIAYANTFIPTYYQRYFPEVILEDGNNPLTPSPVSMTLLGPSSTGLGSTSSFNLTFSYPFDTTVVSISNDYKITLRFTGGYINTNSISNYGFSAYTILWTDTINNLAVLQMPNSFHLSDMQSGFSITGIINPYPYQYSGFISTANTIQTNYYNTFKLAATANNVTQPLYPAFTNLAPLVLVSQIAPSNTLDIYPANNGFPKGMFSILSLKITVAQSITNLQKRQLSRLEIVFTLGVSSIINCWANLGNGSYYLTDSQCQVKGGAPKPTIQLYGFNDNGGRVINGLTVYIQSNITGSLMYTTTLYAVNNQVQYTSTNGPVLMNLVNTSRSLPTIIFPELKYVNNYFEYQIKYMFAVSGQKTPILKFRFINPVTLIYNSSILNIYPPSNDPFAFRNSLNVTNMICTFIPTLANYHQYGIGIFSPCSFVANYIIPAPFGNLVAGKQYLLQIRQNNILTTNFVMPNAPIRDQIVLQANLTGFLNRDDLVINSYASFSQTNILHTTMNVGQLDTITVLSLVSPSLIAPLAGQQLILTLSINGLYYDNNAYNQDDAGIMNKWQLDTLGNFASGYSYPLNTVPVSSAVSVFSFGQYNIFSNQFSPIRISLNMQGGYPTVVPPSQWKIPLLTNTLVTLAALSYNLTLYQYDATIAAPTILSFYSIMNQYYTVSNTETSIGVSLINTNKGIQSSSIDLKVKLNSYSPFLNQVVQMKWDNSLFGLPAFNSLTQDCNSTDLNYICYYFPIINLLQFQKINFATTTIVNLSSIEVSNLYTTDFGFKWIKVHSTSTTPMTTNPYTKSNDSPSRITLTTITSLPTTPTINLLEGLQNPGSTALYLMNFTTPIIPAGGQIDIYISSTYFKFPTPQVGYLGYQCLPLVSFKSITNDNRVLRCYADNINQKYVLSGFDYIPANTPLSLLMYLTVNQYTVSTISFNFNIYGQLYNSTKGIILTSIPSTITLTNNFSASSFYTLQQYYRPYYSFNNNYLDIQGTFVLNTTALSNPHQLQIDYPYSFDTLLATQRLIYRQNKTITNSDWIEPFLNVANTVYGIYTIPSDYLLSNTLNTNTNYIFRLSTYFSPNNNNFSMGSVGQSYRFWLKSLTATGVCQQIYYYQIINPPIPQNLTVVNRLPTASNQTMLELTFTLNIAAVPGDFIQINFDTNNLLYNMFTNDLQGSPNVNGSSYLDCQQAGTLIISNSKLICLLYYGNNLANPPTPAFMHIPITNNIVSATTITILIANVQNPNTKELVSGMFLQVMRVCRNLRNQNCPIYSAYGYYITQELPSLGFNFNFTNQGVWTATPNIVLAANTIHTFTLSITNDIQITDLIYIVYPENYLNILSTTCLAVGYTCYSFNTRNWIVLIPTSIISSGSIIITLQNMNNGYYSAPDSLYFKIIIARGVTSTKVFSQIFYVNHTNLDYIQITPDTGLPTSMTITATQTSPNTLFLRNYNNTVIIKSYYLWVSSFIKAFYITAPSDILSWDPNYCNATLQAATITNNPYPYRLMCGQISGNILQIIIPSTVPQYVIPSQTYILVVNAKFLIVDFPLSAGDLYISSPMISQPFYVHGSASATSFKTNYYISQASTTIPISQHRIPIIGNITFNTQAFQYRKAQTNQSCVFYMLLDPTTAVPVDQFKFYLPVEFGYPPLKSLNNCFIQTTYYDNITTCSQERFGATTIITILVTGYNNGPRIIQLADKNSTFTSPVYPGDFYNMTVQMYSSSSLVEKQTVNISSVWGANLTISSIKIQNGLDESLLQIYDVTFQVGQKQIPPGYYANGTNMSSQIQIIFENINGWLWDLGTGLPDGSEVGCFIKNGLISGPERIKCLLHIGTSYIDQPMIRIINYMPINPQTNVQISISNIKNKVSMSQNTAYVAVMLFYHNLTTQSYLYVPTSKLINTTSPLSAIPFTTAIIGYIGNNVVLTPSTLNITIAPTFSMSIKDYIVITFSENIIDPYNPTNYSCSLGKVEVFYISGIIRIYPYSPINSGVNTSFIINNFSSSAYAMTSINVSIKIDAYSNRKIKNTAILTLSRTVEKCTFTKANIISTSSLYGGDINVTYVFSFIPNIQLKSNSAFTLTIPSQYGNLLTNKAYCNISLQKPAYCTIVTPYRIDIYLNGTSINATSMYLLNVTGLINPNIAISNLSFVISSYFDDNLYLNHIVCQNSITPPTIIVKNIRSCGMSLNLDYYNSGYNSQYNFLISCTDVIKQNSTLYIYLDSAYRIINNNFSKLCHSYQSTTLISPVCNLSYVNGKYALIIPILSSSSQISVTIQAQLINPIASSYKFYAQFYSQGILFSQTTQYTINITKDTYTVGAPNQILLYNNPRQAGTEGFYIFRVKSFPLKNITDTFTIGFPSNFENTLGDSITASIVSTTDSNLFSKFTYLNLDQISANTSNNLNLTTYGNSQISINSLSRQISISGISTLINNTTSGYYFYYIVDGVINPSSYVNQTFKFTYSSNNQTLKILNWVTISYLVYYIASPPLPMIINKISVSDYDTQVPAIYTFNISSSNIILQPNQQLAIIIEIPQFYNDTFYADKNIICSLTLPISVDFNCSLYGKQLVTLLNTSNIFTPMNNFSIIVNQIYNPTLNTYCNTTDNNLLQRTLFKVKILNINTNQITYESSSNINISNCLTFTSFRLPILTSYLSTMQRGLVYNFTFAINKTTQNLKIVPYCPMSKTITFNPQTIEFSNYKTYNITASILIGLDTNIGSYWINFHKYESNLNTIYKPLLPVLVNIISAQNVTNNYATIRANLSTYSYVGYPIVVPIILSIPSVVQLNLIITVKQQINNGNLLNYSSCYGNYSISPRVITILPNTILTNFTILYHNTTVPPPITLSLKLSSLYPIIYNLTTPTLYISFFKDPTYQITFPPMKVVVSSYPQANSLVDQGKSVLNVFINNNTQNVTNIVTPVIINITKNSIGSTFALINVYTKAEYTLYYAILEIGYTAPKDYSQLIYFNYSHAINSGSLVSFKNSSNLVNCGGIVNASNLQSSSAYSLFIAAFNSMGYSPVITYQFNTTELSSPVELKITLNQIETPLTIVNALKETLGIAGSRIKVLTSTRDLSVSSNSSTNNLNYTYTVIIGPNPINDNPNPYTLVSNFVNSSTLLGNFSKFLPSWVNTSSIPYKIYHVVRPKIVQNPQAKLIHLYNATFTIKFWAQSKIYSILIKNTQPAPQTLNVTRLHNLTRQSNASIIFPTSKQIKNGKDMNNNMLAKDLKYQGETDINGRGIIFFNNIIPGSSYSIYVTGGSMLPYEPTYLLNDEEVVRLDFHTLYNLNINNVNCNMKASDNEILKELMDKNPGLAQTIINKIQTNALKYNTKK